MDILILGGSGYLASKIAKQLVDDNNIVCTRRKESKMQYIERELNNRKDEIKFIPASLEAIQVALQYTSFDIVINLVCNYGRNNTLYDNVLEANIEFPLEVLNCLVEHGTKRFITIGTGLPVNFNMYSFSKNIFSEFGEFYVKQHGINFINLKLEMFYGWDEPRNRFIPGLIHDMIDGKEINVTVGTQLRDIIAVDDVVMIILAVVKSNLIEGFQEISIGTGVAPAISELVNYIWERTGRKSKINYGSVPLRYNEPDCVADITLIKKFIIKDYEPIFWKDGILNMIEKIKMEGK